MIPRPFVPTPLGFTFHYGATSRASALDDWLRQAFGADAAELSAGIPENLSQDPCAAYVARLLWLGRTILRCWRIPAFEAGRIERILPQMKSDTLRCEISEPMLDCMPRIVHETAYALSSEAAVWCMRNPVSDARVVEFNARFEDMVKKGQPPLELGAGSTLPVLKTAYGMGIPFFHLGRGIYQLGLGSRARTLDRSHGEGDSFVGVLLAGDKAAAARLLRARGLPVPLHEVVVTKEAAASAAASLGFPVVVKPLDAARGEGVTVDVESSAAAGAAFERAKAATRSRVVLVEKQVAGVCHRLFIVKGQLLYAVKRLPLYVTGDGTRSLAQLVKAGAAHDLKRPFWLRDGMATVDDAALAALKARGNAPDSVPPRGARVYLRPIETTAWGGIDEDASAIVHPMNLAAAVAAAETFGLEVAGVDMITTDLSLPWTETGAAINEVNGGPLLGGAAISLSHVPRFLDIYLGGRGLIGFDMADAGSSLAALRAHQDELLAGGVRCWIVFDDAAIDHERNVLRPVERGAPNESAALRLAVLNRALDHVILVRGPAPSGRMA
jgi:cyanophycin synthetase